MTMVAIPADMRTHLRELILCQAQAHNGRQVQRILDAALARSDLSQKAHAFLLDLQRQAACRPLTPRQYAAMEQIIRAPSPPDFSAINRAALARLPEVLERLLPGGRQQGSEWRVGSVRGEPGQSLKVRLYGDRAGMWRDFATDDHGGDVVSLAAAVAGLSQSEAARRLAAMLGLEGRGHD
jgi:hypothetical protein